MIREESTVTLQKETVEKIRNLLDEMVKTIDRLTGDSSRETLKNSVRSSNAFQDQTFLEGCFFGVCIVADGTITVEATAREFHTAPSTAHCMEPSTS